MMIACCLLFVCTALSFEARCLNTPKHAGERFLGVDGEVWVRLSWAELGLQKALLVCKLRDISLY